MYLLKRIELNLSVQGSMTFTFHYVSIKTGQALNQLIFVVHLHSTMYLLKRKKWKI